MSQIAQKSPQLKARVAAVFYLLVFVTGTLAFVAVRGRLVASLAATVCYVIVTVLFYELFKPVNRRLSLLAAFFSLVGCAVGALNALHLVLFPVNSLVFFGFYCLLIGYLVFKSTFLPRVLGVLMALGGLGWLTFASPSLVRALSPYNMAPGVFGEGMLTLWLLVMGVNVQRWHQQATAATA